MQSLASWSLGESPASWVQLQLTAQRLNRLKHSHCSKVDPKIKKSRLLAKPRRTSTNLNTMDTYNIDCVSSNLERGLNPTAKLRDGAQRTSPSPYYERVIKPRLQNCPWLENLAHFMDPDATDFGMDHVNNHRMKHFDIKVIQISNSQKPASVIKCSDIQDFESATEGVDGKEEDRAGTIIVAKGISRAMIDALGSRFELEPDFFADYLLGTELYRMGRQKSHPPERAQSFILKYARTAPFYSTEFRRPLHIVGCCWTVLVQLRTTKTTTPRGIIFIHGKLPDVFAAERISVYKRKGSKIAIVLTDQLLSDTPPASHMPILVTSPEPQDLGIDRRRHQVSTRREIVSWAQGLSVDEAKALFDDRHQFALRPVLRMVERGGLMFLDHVRYLVQRILVRICDDQFPNSSAFFLEVSRSLEVYIYRLQRFMSSSLRAAKLRGGDDITDIELDFSYLIRDMENELQALKDHVKFFVAESSIQEGKMVGWVTKLAAVFLPISLLATILSINDPGYTRWAILGGLGGPFVIVLTFLMFSSWSLSYFNTREYKGIRK